MMLKKMYKKNMMLKKMYKKNMMLKKMYLKKMMLKKMYLKKFMLKKKFNFFYALLLLYSIYIGTICYLKGFENSIFSVYLKQLIFKNGFIFYELEALPIYIDLNNLFWFVKESYIADFAFVIKGTSRIIYKTKNSFLGMFDKQLNSFIFYPSHSELVEFNENLLLDSVHCHLFLNERFLEKLMDSGVLVRGRFYIYFDHINKEAVQISLNYGTAWNPFSFDNSDFSFDMSRFVNFGNILKSQWTLYDHFDILEPMVLY